jgi:hypothetical protein
MDAQANSATTLPEEKPEEQPAPAATETPKLPKVVGAKKPVAKKAAAKPTPAPAPKAKPPSKLSAMKKIMIESPKLTPDQIVERMAKMPCGASTVSTVATVRADLIHSFRLLRELGFEVPPGLLD